MARVLPLSLTVFALLILPALAVPALLAMALPALAQADALSGTPPAPVDATMPLPPLEERLGNTGFTIVESTEPEQAEPTEEEAPGGDAGGTDPVPVASPD